MNAGRVDENSLVGRVDVEVSAEVVNFSNTTTRDTPNNKRSISAVIDCTRYSSLKKLVLTTGYVMRFVINLRKRVGKKHSDMVNDIVLTIDEYNKALMMWIKEEQILMKEQSNTLMSICNFKSLYFNLLILQVFSFLLIYRHSVYNFMPYAI